MVVDKQWEILAVDSQWVILVGGNQWVRPVPVVVVVMETGSAAVVHFVDTAAAAAVGFHALPAGFLHAPLAAAGVADRDR